MFNKLIVSAYKIAGFVILLVVLLGLGSYVVMSAFYYASASWTAPIIISPSDKRVLELSAQMAQQQTLRDTLAAQRAELVTKQRDADRIAVAELEFQHRLRGALQRDLAARKETLGKLAGLRKEYGLARTEISSANTDFAGLSRDRVREMFSARMVSRDDVLRGNMELASLAAANLNLTERTVLLDEQVSTAARQAAALKSLAESLGQAAGGPVSTEVVALEREYAQSTLAMQRATEGSLAIKESLLSVDTTLARYDSLLKGIKGSPYLTAFERQMTVAFVPYTNLRNVKVGASVHSCALNIVGCHKVGTVQAILDGEVTGAHPVQKLELRGVMVRLELTDPRCAQDPVLHLNHAPFYL